MKSNQEKKKYLKELHICLINALNGRKIKHLPDKKDNDNQSYDILCDETKAELKKTKSATNIVKYAIRATKRQGAHIVLFEFEEWKNEIRDAVSEMIRKNIHGHYFVTGSTKTHEF